MLGHFFFLGAPLFGTNTRFRQICGASGAISLGSAATACHHPFYHIYSCSLHSTESTMVGNYRHISEDQKKLVITMSLRGMKGKDIELATGIKCRTIQWLISMWNSTGEVVKHSLERGRPQVLTSLEVLVSVFLFLSTMVPLKSVSILSVSLN